MKKSQCSTNLSGPLQSVKTVADCQESCWQSRRLHSSKTVADCQEGCIVSRQLQSVKTVAVSFRPFQCKHVCSCLFSEMIMPVLKGATNVRLSPCPVYIGDFNIQCLAVVALEGWCTNQSWWGWGRQQLSYWTLIQKQVFGGTCSCWLLVKYRADVTCDKNEMKLVSVRGRGGSRSISMWVIVMLRRDPPLDTAL